MSPAVLRIHRSIRRNSRRRGMSLIEIMIAITILAMMSAGVAVFLIPQIGRARQDRAVTDIKAIESALTLYNARKGKFPDTATGLKALVDSQDLKELPKDPWNNDYIYTLEGNKPIIITYGADGAAGGDEFNADISNRKAPQK